MFKLFTFFADNYDIEVKSSYSLSSILIDGTEYSVNTPGHNVVYINSNTGAIVSAGFNTRSDSNEV